MMKMESTYIVCGILFVLTAMPHVESTCEMGPDIPNKLGKGSELSGQERGADINVCKSNCKANSTCVGTAFQLGYCIYYNSGPTPTDASNATLSIKQCQEIVEKTPIVCHRSGQTAYYSADCHTGKAGINVIAVNALYYGAKPSDINCQSDACCHYTARQDCLFKDPNFLSQAVSTCSGQRQCTFSPVHRLPTSKGCSGINARFPFLNDFGYMEYTCINVGKIRDICPLGKIDRGKQHYLASNLYHNNSEQVNTTCGCTAITRCNVTMRVKVIDVRLPKSTGGDCLETLTFSDASQPDHNTSMTCTDGDLGGWQEVFVSKSNKMDIELDIGTKHQGKIWILVEATDGTSDVELLCGKTRTLPPSSDLICPPDTTTSPSDTTTSLPDTSRETTSGSGVVSDSSTSGQQKPGDQNFTPSPQGVSPGVIGGIVAVAVLLLIVLIVVMFLVFRSRSHHHDSETEDICAQTDIPAEPVYDNFIGQPHYASLEASGVTKDPRAFVNATYFHSPDDPLPQCFTDSGNYSQIPVDFLRVPEGATADVYPEKPGYREGHPELDPEQDNAMNETVLSDTELKTEL